MEEQIVEILRKQGIISQVNYQHTANEIASHIKEFILWTGSHYQFYFDTWTLYCDNVYETENPFYTTEELYQLWLKEVKK